MSDELEAFRVAPGVSIEEAFARHSAAVNDAPDGGFNREALAQLVDALVAAHPDADAFDDEDGVIVDDGVVQVFVYDDDSAVFAFRDGRSDEAMQRVPIYARVLREVRGLTVIDPQTREVFHDG